MGSRKRSLRRRSSAYMGCDDEPTARGQEAVPTPREAMRRANCQDYRFHQAETYPSIRPRVSRCDPSRAQALAWLAKSIEADGCGRPFDMEQDDVLLVWRQSPHKDTLGFYGVGSPSLQPETMMFNEALMASLDKASASGTKQLSRKPTPPPPSKKTPLTAHSASGQVCLPFILNRQALQTELQKMPIVQRRLHPRAALETVFCTDPPNPSDPFGLTQHKEGKVSRAQALGMQRRPRKVLHGLRRRHWYCPMDCGGVQTACTQYEWAKYRLDPRPYNKEFRQWLRGQKELKSPEPRDYDQLYDRFLQCFEQEPEPDPLCKIYEICCQPKRPRDDEGTGGGTGQGGGGGGGDGTDGTDGGDGNKDKDKDKDKDQDGDKDKDKDKDKIKDKDKDKDTDNDKDTDKNKDKNKDMSKDARDGKDKDKGEGDGGEGGDGKRKDKHKGKGGKGGKDKGKDKDKEKDEHIKNKDHEDPDKPSHIKGTFNPDQNDPYIGGNHSAKDQGEPEKDKGGPGGAEDGTGGLEVPSKDKPTDKDKSKKVVGSKDTDKDKDKDTDIEKDKDKGKRPCPDCPLCPPPDCQCEICQVMDRHRTEPDAPFIQDMKRAEHKRQLRAYYRQMCHREYIRNRCREDLRAPLHKCDPISCDNIFCRNPRLAEHCDCLGAVQDLQKLLAGGKDKSGDSKLLNRVEDLRRRICQRMCDCILA